MPIILKHLKRMKKKINLTVIIPVHTTEIENFNEFIKNAVDSINQNDVAPEYIMIVAPKKDKNILEEFGAIKSIETSEIKFIFLTNDGPTDFASQMNFAVSKVETEYFSFLEFDDEYSRSWFRNVDKYFAEYPEISAFLPIVSDVNSEKQFLGYTNEIAWAYEFTDKHGIIDADTLKEYPNFNPDGLVMRVADFIRIGGYKPSIKLSFNLEFLLRACDQSAQIMVIPKIGYQHMNMRPESLFWHYKNGDNKLSVEEATFWMETAKKEFYYIDDRKIEYNPTEEDEITKK